MTTEGRAPSRRGTRILRWTAYTISAVAACYAVWFGIVLRAMMAPPEQFGQFMRRMPAPLVWAPLPAMRMWGWARAGGLAEGDPAPDFTLRRQGQAERVTLSAHRGRPVVLVFGSYT
jgi:hypothetical protein